ncbi:MAG: acyl-CoA thioesterase II [Alphaproteobacteria bacterium]|nr:acyl-CoA thioesterase II [Alphaproteobacteria bacterium]
MTSPAEDLIRLLDLEKVEENIFRGFNPGDNSRRVFGGQVLAQALVAAARTASPERLCHSLHAYFLRAGDPAVPILYEVDRSRDGGSFSVRRVVAIQHGEQIFVLASSFQKQEAGFEHQAAMPDVPSPESLSSAATEGDAALLKGLWRSRPFEFRPVLPRGLADRPARPPLDHIWFRLAQKLDDEPVLHQAFLAYASDMSLLDTALLPHGKGIFSNVQVASLDHAMWFHRPFRIDDWLLYSQDSPNAYGARGFSRGLIFARDGTLVASVGQEGLIRPR